MSEEQVVWKGSPSQVVNLGYYILCLVTCLLVVPIFIAVYLYIKTRTENYEVTTERLKHSTGILSRQTETMELYRIKDTTVLQPFFLRLFGLGSILLHTSDKTTPEMLIPAVANPQWLNDQLRKHIEEQRQTKRVREVDFE
jgi:uncharacterized membrane protein YdbT with pleckstrin-like domain